LGYDLSQEIILMRANFKNIDLTQEDLSGLVLLQANFNGTNLSVVDLSNSDLTESDFTKANLYWTDLSNSILQNAKIGLFQLQEVTSLRRCNYDGRHTLR